jgi:hypothetical protein
MKNAKTVQPEKLKNIFMLAIPELERTAFLLDHTHNRTHEIEQLNEYEKEELLERLAKVVKMAAPNQIQKLQCLYRELRLTEHKKEILLHFTKGRTDSTAGLTFDEARDLIQDIAQHEPTEKMRKAIFSLAYQAGIIYGESDTDKKINRAKLNIFLRERGTVKKDIEKQTLTELKNTYAQCAAIVKSHTKTADNKQAKQLTDQLLNELNITIQ